MNDNQFDEIIDFKQFFYKIINNWHFLGLSLLLTFATAFLYNRYTNELYLIETSILIKENNSMESASELLFEKTMGSTNISMENKVLMLKSYPLVYSTLSDLGFNVNVGNIVWNQCKKELTDDKDKTLLIYSSDITDNKLVTKEYSNNEKKNYIDKPGFTEPLLIINRGYYLW